MSSFDGFDETLTSQRADPLVVEADLNKAWETLANMEGLQYLRVEFDSVWDEPMSSETETHLLQPAKSVTKPKIWTLWIHWENNTVDHGKTPFRIYHSRVPC